eukprot:CAMPEP_0172452424 /NCGR_PEP_ID=MMETSP1065-20121228/10095_1 /TAXON_ID=265537 /ORGANISM="Amphiprora paludosa, Strain CCMP125" /LENGTH=62 /DNA_ID=CAMNT_0013204479 /DNA_START=10 /DNA_END=198 /DNA_ORIENTATION=+
MTAANGNGTFIPVVRSAEYGSVQRANPNNVVVQGIELEGETATVTPEVAKSVFDHILTLHSS